MKNRELGDDFSEIQNLLSLKALERPAPWVMEGVEAEFHRRLAADVLAREQRSLPALWARAWDALVEEPIRTLTRVLAPAACAAVILASAVTVINQWEGAQAGMGRLARGGEPVDQGSRGAPDLWNARPETVEAGFSGMHAVSLRADFDVVPVAFEEGNLIF